MKGLLALSENQICSIIAMNHNAVLKEDWGNVCTGEVDGFHYD